MVLSEYAKRRTIFYDKEGYRAPTIAKLLRSEDIVASRQAIHAFLRRVRTAGMARKAGSGRPRKRTSAVKDIIETAMREDDEATAKELQMKLSDAGHQLSLSTTLRCRTELGWTRRRTAYCQMIRHENKAKRLAWARANLHEAEAGFLDVIWTDETSVHLENHRRYCCRKIGERPKNKPR